MQLLLFTTLLILAYLTTLIQAQYTCIRCYTSERSITAPPSVMPTPMAFPSAPSTTEKAEDVHSRRKRKKRDNSKRKKKDDTPATQPPWDTWEDPNDPNPDRKRPFLQCSLWDKDGNPAKPAAQSNYSIECKGPCVTKYQKYVMINDLSTFIREEGERGCGDDGFNGTSPNVCVDDETHDRYAVPNMFEQYLKKHKSAKREEMYWFQQKNCYCRGDYCNRNEDQPKNDVLAKWNAVKDQFKAGGGRLGSGGWILATFILVIYWNNGI